MPGDQEQVGRIRLDGELDVVGFSESPVPVLTFATEEAENTTVLVMVVPQVVVVGLLLVSPV